MINWNDYPNNNTAISLFLNTVNSTGTAGTITNGAIGIFVNNSASFLTTGITFTADFASRTGIHLVNIPSGTITGTNVTCTAFYVSGVVDSISVANRLVGVFSVGRYGQAPDNFSGLIVGTDGLVNVNVVKQSGASMPSGDFTTTMKTSINTQVAAAIASTLSMTSGAVNAYPIGDFSPSQKTSITTQATASLTGNLFIQSGVVRAVPTGDFTTTMKTSINTEMLDVMNVDTYAEPAQGTPPTAPTYGQMFRYLYKNWRNKKTQTSTSYELYNSAGTVVDHKASVSGDSSIVQVNDVTTGP